jgi:hypothetical protein
MEIKLCFKNKWQKLSVLHNLGIVITAVIMAFAVRCTLNKGFYREEALNAFIKALKEDNKEELLSIFGSDANDLVSSGDEVIDKQRRQKFLDAYDEQHKLDADGNNLVIVAGKNDWPFPIPIIKQGQEWIFDTDAGMEEIINRRIGQNELDTIQVMLAIVEPSKICRKGP